MTTRVACLSLLFLPLMAPLAEPQAPAIDHHEVKCIVAGKFPRMDACFLPEDVALARVYFRVQGTPAWYYVDMTRAKGAAPAPAPLCHSGVLPRPQKKLVGQHIEYYLEAADRTFASGRTPEYDPLVVSRASECRKDAPVAPISPKGPPAVFPGLPAGFGGGGGVSTLAVVGGLAGAGAVAGGTIALTHDGQAPRFPLQVTRSGSGSGTVSSSPAGISCGGTCSATYDRGTPVTLSATPDSGSTFAGWEGDCSGSGACTVTMDAARNVAARFTRSFTLSVALAGSGSGSVSSAPAGIACPAACAAAYESGTNVVLTARPDAGSAFAGWSGGGCSGGGTCTLTMDAARAVTATFTAPVLLTVLKAGSGSGTVVSDPPGIDCGPACRVGFERGTRVTLSASAASGSTFVGWSGGGCGGIGACSVVLDSSTTVTATFEGRVPLAVTVNGSGNGTVTSVPAGISCSVGNAGTCSAAYANGTLVELTATAASGTAFAGWGGDCAAAGGASQCQLTMNVAHAATATFRPATVTLTVSVDGPGSVSDDIGQITNCTGTCVGTYSFGSTVNLTEIATGDGATFIGWNGACAGTGGCSVAMTQNRTVGAVFGWPLFVNKVGTGTGTVTSNPPGINCGADCDEAYRQGTSVTLTAAAGGGSVFTGWSGPCTGTGTCTVVMDNARFVTASFEAIRTLTLTATVGQFGTGGTVTSSSTPPQTGEPRINCTTPPSPTVCTATYNNGVSVTLTATTRDIVGWGGACAGVTGSVCTLPMDADKSVTVDFSSIGAQRERGGSDPSGPSGPGITWVSLLEVPGGAGQVLFNGQQAAFAGPGVTRLAAATRPGLNRVEARLQKAEGQPGSWRFELSGAESVEPGSLRVLQGDPLLLLPEAIVFRLSGREGEQVAFTFRMKP